MDDDLGVGTGAEDMAAAGKFHHQRLEIVDFAVEDDAHRVVFVEQRLVAAGDIDDRQAAMPEPDARRGEEPVAVGPAMRDRIGHAVKQVAVDRARAARVEDAGDAAHRRSTRGVRCGAGRGAYAVGRGGEAAASWREMCGGARPVQSAVSGICGC
jgi:hypothetical protein